jgi:heme/copper-type cytochrome/quinol oxidase subunit 2
VALIAINYLITISVGIDERITGEVNKTLENWSFFIIPGIILVGICLIILVALSWVCFTFRRDKELASSEKRMTLHFLLTVLIIVSYVCDWLFPSSFTAYKINNVINTIIYLLMAFILDKINGRPMPAMETVKVAAMKTPPVILSSFLMTGEIDLATSMKIKTVIVDESGEEPKVSKTFCLFTETDSNSVHDEDNNNILKENSDRLNLDPKKLINNPKRDE